MSKREERQKASDVFKESPSYFGEKVNFGEAFPMIEDLTIQVEEYKVTNLLKQSIYQKKNLPGEYIDCTNSRCYSGGFSIGAVLRDTVCQKKKRWKQQSHVKDTKGLQKVKEGIEVV